MAIWISIKLVPLASNLTTNYNGQWSRARGIAEVAQLFLKQAYLRYHAQEFEQFSLAKSYQAEEDLFVRTAWFMPRSDVSNAVNFRNRRVLYRVKDTDYGSLKRKARTAPHYTEIHIQSLKTSNCKNFYPVWSPNGRIYCCFERLS